MKNSFTASFGEVDPRGSFHAGYGGPEALLKKRTRSQLGAPGRWESAYEELLKEDQEFSPAINSPVPGEIRDTEEPQLTLRAILLGCALGAVVCCTNVYFGLKTGWGMGANLIVAVLGFAISRTFKDKMGPKENCVVQTAGVAAGSMSSAAGFTSAIPALKSLGHTYSYLTLTLWCLSIGYFGLCFAVPLRKQMIIRDKLKFPSGTATAETIKSMHNDTSGGKDAILKAQFLIYCAVGASCWSVLTYFIPVLENLPFFYWIGLAAVHNCGFSLNTSPAFIGAGMFMGLRVTISMMAGSILGWGILAPIAQHSGWAPGPFFAVKNGAKGWILWIGVACMVADALAQIVSLLFVLLSSMRRSKERRESLGALVEVDVVPEHEQIPTLWWTGGLVASTSLAMILIPLLFNVPWYFVLLGVFLGCLLAIVGVRATGETDINPTGGVGKVTQIIFGALAPGNLVVNLLAASMTAAGASSSADMMQDLKTGHLLRASPRAQFIAQICGVMSGIVFAVPTWTLFSSAYQIPSEEGGEFPATAAQAWKAVAELLANGFSSFPAHADVFALVAFIFTLSLAVANKVLPEKITKWLPSGMSLGIAMIVTPDFSLTMLLGAVLYHFWSKKNPVAAEALGASIASGLVLGEGLTGLLKSVFSIFNLPKWNIGLIGGH